MALLALPLNTLHIPNLRHVFVPLVISALCKRWIASKHSCQNLLYSESCQNCLPYLCLPRFHTASCLTRDGLYQTKILVAYALATTTNGDALKNSRRIEIYNINYQPQFSVLSCHQVFMFFFSCRTW